MKRIPSRVLECFTPRKHYNSSFMELPYQTQSHTHHTHIQMLSSQPHAIPYSLSSTPYLLKWYRQGLSVNMALWPPQIASRYRRQQRRRNKSSGGLRWNEKPDNLKATDIRKSHSCGKAQNF